MSSYKVVKVLLYKECAASLLELNLFVSVVFKEFCTKKDGQILCD